MLSEKRGSKHRRNVGVPVAVAGLDDCSPICEWEIRSAKDLVALKS